MFNVKSRKLVLTLFCSLALALVLTDGALANGQLDAHRMLRKRFPDSFARGNLADIINPGTKDDASDPNGSSSASSASSAPPASSPSSSLSHSPSPSSSLSSSLSQSSSSSSSVSSSSSSSSSSSTPTQLPSTPTQQNDVTSFTPTSTQSKGQKTEFMTVTSSDTGSTSAAAASSGASSTTKTTLTVLIALAASVGGVVIIWTIIRKWKFKPSDKFEDRMQPIDWQPTVSDDSVPGLHRAASTHSHESFHSGGHESDHNSSQQHGSSIRRGVTPLPEHDFTPGPSHLAPGGGYADLARGPSPQPQVTQMHEAQYGVPLHHQGAYDSYGTVNGQRY